MSNYVFDGVFDYDVNGKLIGAHGTKKDTNGDIHKGDFIFVDDKLALTKGISTIYNVTLEGEFAYDKDRNFYVLIKGTKTRKYSSTEEGEFVYNEVSWAHTLAKGKITYVNYNFYTMMEGIFEKGLLVSGKIIFDNHNVVRTFEGDVCYNIMTGRYQITKGEVVYTNGDIYRGEFSKSTALNNVPILVQGKIMYKHQQFGLQESIRYCEGEFKYENMHILVKGKIQYGYDRITHNYGQKIISPAKIETGEFQYANGKYILIGGQPAIEIEENQFIDMNKI